MDLKFKQWIFAENTAIVDADVQVSTYKRLICVDVMGQLLSETGGDVYPGVSCMNTDGTKAFADASDISWQSTGT